MGAGLPGRSEADRLVRHGLRHQRARAVGAAGDVEERAPLEACSLERGADVLPGASGALLDRVQPQGAPLVQQRQRPIHDGRAPVCRRHQPIKGRRARPAALGPAGEGQREGRLAEIKDPEHRQPRAEDLHPGALQVRERPGQREEALAAEGPDHPGGLPCVGCTVTLQDQLPGLEDHAGGEARDQLEAQATGWVLGLAGAEGEEEVVDVDGGELEGGGGQRRRRLDLEETAEPGVGHGDGAVLRGGLALEGPARLEVEGQVPGEAVEAVDEGVREVDEGGAVGGLPSLEEIAGEGEASVGALIPGEDLQGDLVGVDGEHRIEDPGLLLVIGELGVDEGFLGLPDRRVGPLSLLHQVGEVGGPVAPLVAEVALQDLERRHQRVAEECDVPGATPEAHLAAPLIEGEANRGGAARRGDLAAGGVLEADRVCRNRAHARVSCWTLAVMRWALRSAR